MCYVEIFEGPPLYKGSYGPFGNAEMAGRSLWFHGWNQIGENWEMAIPNGMFSGTLLARVSIEHGERVQTPDHFPSDVRLADQRTPGWARGLDD